MARNKPHKPRVFCIGWHKTGTSSMGMALLELGYTVLGARLDMAEPLLLGDKETPIQIAGKFDALQDVPWAALYKELDEAYPGSKFILTTRSEEDWLNSALKHFKDNYIGLHKWLYEEGVLQGNEERYLQRFRQHNLEVRHYFQGREGFLEVNLSAGDGWEKLCRFLDEPIPRKSFPHANKGKHNYNWRNKVSVRLRSAIPAPVRKARVALLEWLGLHRGINRFNNAYINRAVREKERIAKNTKQQDEK